MIITCNPSIVKCTKRIKQANIGSGAVYALSAPANTLQPQIIHKNPVTKMCVLYK